MLVLGFHRVERPAGLEITRLGPGRFERILDWIADSGLAVVEPALAGSGPSVLLTFDDGYQSIAENALPRLAERGWSAIVFLIAAWVGKSDDWDVRLLGRRRRMMEWSEIKERAAAGIEFGSHSLSHCDLTIASKSRLERELADSKAIIEDQLGQPVRHFAYPFGRQNQRVRVAAARAGYECAFATGRGEADDSMAIPRLMLHGLTSAFEFNKAVQAERSADIHDKGWRGSVRSRFFQSLSAGSATVASWRGRNRGERNRNRANLRRTLANP
jgi:peptidoglycan/xylan/chitin deacetylase (PgdA/CDA1 family)